MRGALDADGRWVAPAAWTVREGVTVSLEPCDAADLDVVLVPGLINAHTHLDLGEGEALPATGDFTEWLWGVGGVRGDEQAPDERAESLARSLHATGVTAAGDIDGSRGEGTRGRRRAGLGGRSYLELIGVGAAAARARLADLLQRIDRLGGGGRELGLSPHAPYSVHVDVLPEIARAARRRGLPLAMHLAETPEETRLMTHGDGPFTGLLERIGKGLPFGRPPGLRPIALAERAGLLGPDGLVIHGNDLDDDDVGRLARSGSTVVYCHGTHRHFERPPHRLLDLHRAGVNLALGTDSALSNTGVDLLEELRRLAADRADVPPPLILHAATAGGRRALGLDTAASRFAPGSAAEGALLGPAPDDADQLTAAAALGWFLERTSQVVATVREGALHVHRGEESAVSPAFLDSPTGRG